VRLEQAIYLILKSDAGLAAAVGGRIFAGTIPRSPITSGTLPGIKTFSTGIYPAIVYAPTRAGGDVTRVLGGGCALLEQPVEIFTASRTSYDEAADLEDRIFHLLDEFSGVVRDPASSDSFTIQSVFRTNWARVYTHLDSLQVHQFATEYSFHYLDPLRGQS
jgi:hypothetical protein